jgi:hypothetical protein
MIIGIDESDWERAVALGVTLPTLFFNRVSHIAGDTVGKPGA